MTDPLPLIRDWIEEAGATGAPLPNAFHLATAEPGGAPSVRTVIVKEVDDRGLVVVTSLGSRKARELLRNPRCALVAWWPGLGRQLRVAGHAQPLERATAERIWAARGVSNRLASLVSHQGQEIESLEELRTAAAEAHARHGEDIPCPYGWGGFRVLPEAIEFWTEAEDRLQERVELLRTADGSWRRRLLAP
jgi:pyridoxamine 5'-phosphate oxidase